MMIVLALVAGIGLGYILERGDMCFHSTIRGLFRQPRQMTLVRAYILSLLIATPLVWGMQAAGWIEPWIPPFAWQANLIGGVMFGVGMVIASTCITGLFYKLGHGMVGTVIGLIAWAIGDIITYIGPLAPLRESLNATAITVNGGSATVTNRLGSLGVIGLVVLAIAAVLWLVTSSRDGRKDYWNWPLLGLAVGLFTSLAWLLADAGGSDYTYGTSSVPTSLYLAVTEGQALWSPWITISLFSIIIGAFIAAINSDKLWIRGETMLRYTELGVGGFIMGVSAAISGGCNLGHSLVGVPLLSLGSITTTLSMVIGIAIAHYGVKALNADQSTSVPVRGYN